LNHFWRSARNKKTDFSATYRAYNLILFHFLRAIHHRRRYIQAGALPYLSGRTPHRRAEDQTKYGTMAHRE